MIGGFISKFVGIINEVSSVAINIIKYLGEFAGVFKFVSGIVSKLALPLFVIMTVWDTVKGAIEGFEKEGIVGGIKGAVLGFFNSLIFGPLDMLKYAAAWVLKQFGFEDAAKVLESFSFVTIFSDIIGTMVGSIIKSFQSMFKDLGVMVDQLMSGDILGGIGTAIKIISTRFFMIPDMIIQGVGSVITQILNFFGFTEVAAQITAFLKDFNITDFIINSLTSVLRSIKNFFAGLPGEIANWVSRQAKNLIGMDSEESVGPVGAKPGPNEKIKVNASGSGRGGARTQEVSAAAEWEKKYGATHNPDGSPKLTGTGAANMSDIRPSENTAANMSDIKPSENTTGSDFAQKSNSAAARDDRGSPIILSTPPQKTPQPLSGRGGSRASAGSPNTQRVVPLLEQALMGYSKAVSP